MYRGVQSIAAGATFVPDLRPNDRFGRNGGKVRIRSVVVTGGAAGDILETVFIGNEMVESAQALALESAANRGVDNFIPALEEVGLPADVINVQYRNTNAAARSVSFIIEIQNAP
jgi:hypothetical protein